MNILEGLDGRVNTDPLVSLDTQDVKKTTICILDWDDTCIASSWLGSINRPVDAEDLDDFAILSRCVIAIISKAKMHGRLIIITNAMSGWVQESCTEYMPSVLPYLSDVPIVSAQDKYSHLYTNPTHWKIVAFRDEVFRGIAANSKLNIISIGDGPAEFTAVNSLQHLIPESLNINLITKGVKLLEKPHIKLLIKQLDAVYADMDSIIELQENINRKMQMKDVIE